MGIRSLCDFCVFQHDKIAMQIYTFNNTVNILSLAGYMMDLWNVCTVNVMPMYHYLTSQMVNKNTCHFRMQDYTNLYILLVTLSQKCQCMPSYTFTVKTEKSLLIATTTTVVVTNEDLVCYNTLPMRQDIITHDCTFTFTPCINNST
jgi:hypothetical protein